MHFKQIQLIMYQLYLNEAVKICWKRCGLSSVKCATAKNRSYQCDFNIAGYTPSQMPDSSCILSDICGQTSVS